MKYRIIEERDLNGEGHFEIELWQRPWFKWKWVSVCKWNFDFSETDAWKFDTREAALFHLQSLKKSRTVIDEGIML